MKRQLTRIAANENPSEATRQGGTEEERDPKATTIIESDKIEFEKNEESIVFYAPASLGTTLVSTVSPLFVLHKGLGFAVSEPEFRSSNYLTTTK